MSLFSDFFGAVYQAQQSGGSLKDKLEQIAPVAKKEYENLAEVSKHLEDVYGDIRKALDAPDFNSKSENVKKASDKWDKYFEEYYIKKAIHDNPEKYASYPDLTDQQKEELMSDVQKIRESIEGHVKDHVGENLFELGSKVKNQADDVLADIGKYIDKVDKIAKVASDIEKGVPKVIAGIEEIAGKGQVIFGKIFHTNAHDYAAQSVWINNFANIGVHRLGMVATAVGGAAGGVSAMLAAFKTGDFKGGINAVKSSADSVRETWTSTNDKRKEFFSQKESLKQEVKEGRHIGLGHNPQKRPDPKEDDKLIGGTEYVSEIIFLLDGKKASGNSMCVVDDIEYLLSNFQLSQSLLSPMTLSFTMMKNAIAEEDEKDVKYDVCKKIIGLDVEMTVKTSYSEKESKPASQFKFKGLITGVSSSRGGGGASSIYVTASTYDYLLQGAPNCRSFENKTLEEIVTAVAGSVKQLKCRISPRLKTPLPYIVQFNQPDYDFLADLARRFGEWMYHSGTEFIFGEIVPPSEEVVKMRYPSGNLFTHGVDLRLRDMNILHVAPNMYDYGKDGVLKLSDDGKADRNSHELNDAAFERVKKLYANQAVYYPHVGGFNDNGKEEGTKEILENSIKVVSRGKRAQMLITNGDSKVAKLFIGQQFQIEDGVENVSTDKGEVDQHPMMVLDVTHTFGLDQNYGNVFDALPPSCDYPPYGNSDIYTTAYPQRATVMANGDPMDLGRVRVQFPWQKVQDNGEENMWTPWIRIVTAYAGLSKGSQFVPELKEEVMVGFEMGNVERPFVIGSLFNGTQNPDPEWRARVVEGTANNIKAIRTSSGHTLQFCDEGGGGSIQMYDYGKNNYSIHLDSDGKYIRIEAKGDVQISAGNDVGIKAAHNISIQAGDNISMESGKDTDISADANMSVSAKDNMQQQATDIYVKASDSISEQSGNSHIIKTTTLQEKSSAKTSLDGGGLIEITAGKVDIR